MFSFCLTYIWLYWTRPTGPPAALAEGIQRMFVKTPDGDIELLCARPDKPTSTTPVVFAHGGMGSAWVWTPYMQYLSRNGIPCFAVSTRGHGESWHPSFLRMLYATTRRMLANDLIAGIKAVEKMEGSEVVLVGHSSGGGLSQFIVNEGDVKVKGLGLLDAVPGNGSYGVYLNWARFDPWFAIRMIFHGWHPNSPLSHPFLTRRAFFSDEYPEEDLIEFQSHISRYESFLWPFSMMLPFVNARRLLGSIRGWDRGNERILIMAGTKDKLMTQDVQNKAADTYRDAFSKMVSEKKIDAEDGVVVKLVGEGDEDNGGRGVRLAWVPGAGHHVQNDVQWKVGAAKLLAWFLQL
ncbi:Alpha/Beta hydrolase protein [Coprinopsis sp. MPI-PUGE-AT-0042]|nr:Alpha/Beta hydrolase protein [Coprinopsis sp. MPI-PUGE-AT-0042]